MQLYDGEDRMGRSAFLREYDVDAHTETRARAEGLPWPPWIVLGARVYYSRTLVSEWFSRQTVGAVEMPGDDELVEVARGP